MTRGSNEVAVAATNNVLQSEAVLAVLGSSGSFTDDFWSNDHSFDIPYANGATLGSAENRAGHQAAIERLSASRSPETRTHIMDSWAALDLTPLGFRVLVTDEWFVRKTPPEVSPAAATDGIEIIQTPDGLAEFERASVLGFGGAPPYHPGHTYPAALLADDRFTFFGLRIDGELASGVFLFRDPACVGVFTFFTIRGYRGKGLGTILLQEALSHAPDTPIATNPSAMSRGIFEQLGFRSIGARRIWAR